MVAAITLFPSNVLRTILGIPFVLFFPGYVLMAALFPGKRETHVIEWIGLSLVMSFAIVAIIGLILNYNHGGYPPS